MLHILQECCNRQLLQNYNYAVLCFHPFTTVILVLKFILTRIILSYFIIVNLQEKCKISGGKRYKFESKEEVLRSGN